MSKKTYDSWRIHDLGPIYAEIRMQCAFASIARARMDRAMETIFRRPGGDAGREFWEAAQSYVVAAGVVVDLVLSGQIPAGLRAVIKARLGIDDDRFRQIKDIRNGFVHQGDDLADILFRQAEPIIVDCLVVDTPEDAPATGLRHCNAFHGTLHSRRKQFRLAEVDAELARIGAAAKDAAEGR